MLKYFIFLGEIFDMSSAFVCCLRTYFSVIPYNVLLQLIPYMVMDVLGQYPGLPGLFVAAMFSGALR